MKWVSSSCVFSFIVFLSLARRSSAAPDLELEALVEDAQCSDLGAGSDCALQAMQLRSRRVLGEDATLLAGESCQAYGCVGYVGSHACQCNEQCRHFGNCCHDFESRCSVAASPSAAGSCQAFGCVGYASNHSCQCNEKCRRHDNCCHDFEVHCAEVRQRFAVPRGVNLGGWLVLEDWFFSGNSGRHVMTKGNKGQGACLPPLLHNSQETKWPSEGILTKWLERSRGEEAAVQIFEAHRQSFIGESDLEDIARLGIRSVRIPLPWTAFADALSPLDAEAYAPGAKIVPDPYYRDEVSFVTVDRDWLAGLLRKAAHHNLKVFLDLHTMPGGSSDATYSGVWPLPPKFWIGNARVGKSGHPLREAGLLIVDAFIQWVESLGEVELSAVGGLTLLNEPAHMSRRDEARGEAFTKGEKQVMEWVAEAASAFRHSSLPARGVKLYVSMTDSAFQFYWDTVPAWWARTFSRQERHSWAVFDVHFYDAWTPKCSGRVNPGGGYVCSQPIEEIRSLVHSCHEDYLSLFAKKIDGLKASTEFSVATFEDPVLACRDERLLHMYLDEQVNIFKRFQVEAFFWSWRMPYGRNFESAWSLKHLAGLETLSDASTEEC